MDISFFKQFKITLGFLFLMALLLGIIYPLSITGLAQLMCPWKSNDSLLVVNHKIIGSELIGQAFDDPKYFWGRPSATTPTPYNAAASSGSNLGPTNPQFLAAVQSRINLLHQFEPYNHAPIPVDLVTASGSGLDPDISPLAAFYQVPRIANVRGLSIDQVHILVVQAIKDRQLGFLGEPRVNVLELNLALDNLTIQKYKQ